MPPTESPARYLDHPQLAALLNTIPLFLFGINDWALRLSALIVATLSLLLLLALLRRLYDETTSLLAGSIYVLFPITGYFYWVGYWMFPVIVVAFWCYITIIDGFKDKSEPRLIHFLGLGTMLFLMVQLGWVGFMYAAAIGTHYVIFSLQKRSMPDLKLFLILLVTPLLSLALIFLILIAARGWNYQQMIDLYAWRSTLSSGGERSSVAWWANFLNLMRTNFTLPVLVLVGAYFLDAVIQRGRIMDADESSNSGASSQKLIEQDGSTRGFRYVWIFLMPGVFYTAIFTETMWVHQYMYRHFSLFLAIVAALTILRIRDLLMTRNLVIANIMTALILITIFVFCTMGLNTYHDIEWYPPKQIEMFVKLKNKIPPEHSLLSYESHIINSNPAKGSFYRPQVAWYLDREIVVARSLLEIQEYAATGRFPYYLIANTGVPLFRELKKLYKYKYVQGYPGNRMKVGMSPYHIFDLRAPKK